MSDDELHKAIQKGRRAQSILDNEAFNQAVKLTKQELLERWEVAKDPTERDRIWHCVNLLPLVERSLIKTANNGKVAKHDLDKLTGVK